MDGDITVESEYERGSVFTVTLPQEVTHKQTEPLNYTGKREETAAFTAPMAKVLVVDDIEFNRRVMTGLLSPWQMEVHKAAGGKEAIRMAEENQYDLIFMDHMMDELDGVETAQAIRELPGAGYADIPIIAVSANAVSGMREYFLKKGFEDFIAKPIEIPALEALIARCIPQSKHGGGSVKPKNAAFMPAVGREFIQGRLDLLKHYAWHFQQGAEADDEYLLRFTNLIASFRAGATDENISETARILEDAGRERDMAVIKEQLPRFYNILREHFEKPERELNDFDNTGFKEGIGRLIEALEKADWRSIDRIITELRNLNVNKENQDVFIALYDMVLMRETGRLESFLKDFGGN
jgi:CheY-like chemotaxis protein